MTSGLTIRPLVREEVGHVWSIDRSELIEKIYYNEGGRLVARPERYDLKGWPPGATESTGARLLDCFDRGGFFCGAFEGERLRGVVVLESRFIGEARDQLQLKFLHVSRDLRKMGLGRRLFEVALAQARELGARRLYVSATPSENTVQFYLHLGFRVTTEVDAALFELEPDDIHMQLEIKD